MLFVFLTIGELNSLQKEQRAEKRIIIKPLFDINILLNIHTYIRRWLINRFQKLIPVTAIIVLYSLIMWRNKKKEVTPSNLYSYTFLAEP